MRGYSLILALCVALIAPMMADAAIETGKVVMVVENHLIVRGDKPQEAQRFDITDANIYRNGLPVRSSALVSGDWVTVTTEKQQDGVLRVTLVDAGSDR